MKALAICVFVTAFVVSTAFADLEDGRRAANRGDFKSALREWAPIAEAGDPEAAFLIGRLYARGDGVARNFTKAREYWEQAAMHGHRGASEKISYLYLYGDGVKKDPAMAAAWKRAAAGGPIPPIAGNQLAARFPNSNDDGSSGPYGKVGDVEQPNVQANDWVAPVQEPTPSQDVAMNGTTDEQVPSPADMGVMPDSMPDSFPGGMPDMGGGSMDMGGGLGSAGLGALAETQAAAAPAVAQAIVNFATGRGLVFSALSALSDSLYQHSKATK